MRSAALSLDDDFGPAEAPARKKSTKTPVGRAKSGGKANSGGKTKKGRRFGISMTKVARVAAIGMSATITIGILVNALVMQKGHHPAPLFGKAIVFENAGDPAPARPVRQTKAQTEAQAQPQADAAPVDEPQAPVPAARSAAPTPTVAAKTGSDDDPIGRLLRTGTVPAAEGGASQKAVLGVQRALAKLGYDVKPNGTMGATTRKAMMAYEKSHGLPVKSDITRKLVKVLGAESGVKID